MSMYLTSFYPLVCTNAGKMAAKQYGLKPFIDGSCRREPDFENAYPAVTGLCRPGFATKLKKGDILIYLSNKKGIGVKKVVAILEVIVDGIESHAKAAKWYLDQQLILPNNIMVDETQYHALDKTHRMHKCDSWGLTGVDINGWNNEYIARSNDYPTVAICRFYKNLLDNPVDLTDEEMKRIFGRMPATRNPPRITNEEWIKLKAVIERKISPLLRLVAHETLPH